jgi:hypothetical protein
MSNQELINKVYNHKHFLRQPSIKLDAECIKDCKTIFWKSIDKFYSIGDRVYCDFETITDNKKMRYYFYFDKNENLICGTEFL